MLIPSTFCALANSGEIVQPLTSTLILNFVGLWIYPVSDSDLLNEFLGVLQVREFFALQKSRVKAFIQQCSDEAKPHIAYEIVEGRPDQMLESDLSFTKLTDVDSVEILLETMRQELYFTQQEKILQIILQTEPGLILRRYVSTLFYFDFYGHVFLPRHPSKFSWGRCQV